ncbi:MAG: adenosylcobinamide-GDP ribazoletransferase [Acetobacteraceae bacterium]|nr:adenosylcobinamide-GDP ribazoletransferase [Acetobacteraceae bacterium]MBV8526513.1 adenosylcobinamide-GDP ribazoletransferase [Acetobacteraceae bacterium]
MLSELAAAFTLLTRLPLTRRNQAHTNETFANAVWAYPIVGVAVGGIAAAVYGLCVGIGLNPSLAAICALTATALVTGALHEDGLADLADGFGGGNSREHKLAIMRDSRIGTYGVSALILSLAARGAALATIAAPDKVGTALIAGAAIGRGAMIVPLLALAPAREDGLAAHLHATPRARAFVGLILAAASAFFLLHPAAAIAATVSAMLAAVCLSGLAQRQIGGYTGDVFGAAEVIAECMVLGVLATSGGVGIQ